MLIIGDETRWNGRIPWVTGSLILLNILAFLAQKGLGDNLTRGFSLVPEEITTGRDLVKPQKMKVKVPYWSTHPRQQAKIKYKETWVSIPQAPGPFPIYLTLLTSMFLHADWLHLIGNMWFLAIFGRNVETALNHGRFLAYYLISGLAGGLAHVTSDPHAVIPCLGASGAISGIMGSYLAIYPFNKIKMWFGWYIGVVEVPAVLALGVWFLWQYVSAFVDREMGHVGGGVAYWDHLGGFVAGMLLIFGTIAYLKWQIDKSPPEEEQDEDSTGPAEPQECPPAPDHFGNFLPAGPPQTVATPVEPSGRPLADDANFLPVRRQSIE